PSRNVRPSTTSQRSSRCSQNCEGTPSTFQLFVAAVDGTMKGIGQGPDGSELRNT
ncbi:hypothetical protein GBAR_LOCUS10355, partial [Geodia barretti]